MITYVVGFAFGVGEVALIRKARPDWQKGRLNGIGGHIEEGESSHEAMVREFEEETGVELIYWDLFAKLQGKDWSCDFFRVFGVDLTTLKTTTDEEVVIIDSKNLADHEIINNLKWLIPLALDKEYIAMDCSLEFPGRNDN